MNNRIIVVGSSNADRFMRLPHLPAMGETVSDGVFAQAFGGKGANQAVAAARAGGNVVFVNAVGADAEGAAMREAFAADGIDTSHMVVSPDLPSGAALILLDGEGRNYLAVAPGANYALLPEHVSPVLESGRAAMVILQNEVPAETTNAAIAAADVAGIPVMLNYAPIRDRGIVLDSCITYLVVNENEAAELTGLAVGTADEAFAAGEALITVHGVGNVIVTLGAAGLVMLAYDGLRRAVSAFVVKAVDTTAAGDTFCGALAVSLVEGKPLVEACLFASAASALSVTGAGAQPSIPYRAAIDVLLAARG